MNPMTTINSDQRCVDCNEFGTVVRVDRNLIRCSRCEAKRRNEQRSKKPFRTLLSWARSRRPCSIDEQHLLNQFNAQGGRCYFTGIPLSLHRKGNRLFWMSLDRLDNSKDYCVGNVVLTCQATNMARRDAEPDDFIAFLRAIRIDVAPALAA